MSTTPPATPPGAPAYNPIQTRPWAVSFAKDNIPPTQYVYVREPEQLVVVLLTNQVAQVVKICYRYLTPQNEIKETTVNIGPLTAGVVTLQAIPVTEGWILSISLQCQVLGVAGQWAFAQIQIARSPNFTQTDFGLIWEGYIPFNTATGWPGIASKEITDGAGVLRSITGTTPGAGADISETVPNFRRWQLLSVFATLVTSAAAANRTPTLLLDDGSHTLADANPNLNQPASSTFNWCFENIPIAGSINSNPICVPSPLPYTLRPGFRIRTNTANLQAGDQWTAPQYLVIEWGIWDS